MDRLTRAVVEAKNGDPFAPVSVLVASPAAGVLVRRAIARHTPIANVATYTVAALAAAIAREGLDSAGRAPLSPPIRRRAVRAALADAAADGITIGDAGDHPSTVEALDARFREIRRCSPGAIRALRSAAGAEVVMALYDRFRERVATRWYDDVDVVDEATRKVVAGGPTPHGAGRVVIDRIPPLAHAERRLLDALAEAGSIAGRVDDEVDVDAVQASNVIVAPEPETEVRLAIREVLRLAAQGTAFADMAIVHPGGAYDRLVPELLDAAAVPWGGRSTTTLADTVPGRAVLGLLALRDSDLARGELMALLATAPIVDPATGRVVPAATWERVSRDARVLGGAEQWSRRLERLASELDAAGGPGTTRRLAEIGALRAFVATLAGELEPPAVRTWTAFAGWVLGLMRFIGAVDADDRARVASVVTGLGSLDTVDGSGVDLPAFADELVAQLSRPAGRRPLGEGITIGRARDLAGITARAVVVLGMNDGAFPRRRRDDPLLPDAVRAVTAGELPTRRDRRRAEHVELATILCRSSEQTLCAARADQRAQQQRNPSRWLLAWSPPIGGVSPRRSSDLVPVASFSTAALGDTPTCEQEAALHVLTSGGSAATLGLARNLEAVKARHGSTLSEWDGLVGAHRAVAVDKRVLSPTAVEVWASCPFRHFLRTVLRVDPTNTPEDRVGTDPLERGTLVHEVLERFVRWRLALPAGSPHPSDEEQSAVIDSITDEVCDEFASAGRVGRAVPWELERRTLRADLSAILALDAADAHDTGFRPILTEASFGLGPDDEFDVAEVKLADGRVVRFRGQVDRVDVSPDGARVRVVDYKTGRSKYYREIQGSKTQPAADPTAGGRRLQLPVYATAVAGRYPDAEISAEYWFVTDAAEGYPRVRVVLDDRTRQRFLDVLTHIADAVDDGVFPANPGADQLTTWENCRRCDFDRVCPARRSEAFERRKDDPAMVRFLSLEAGD